MKALKVHEVLPRRALVTRESAEALRPAVEAITAEGNEELALDFEGIEAVTPSFVDQTLSVLQNALRFSSRRDIIFLNFPGRLSPGLAAVARARGVQVNESAEGHWIISPLVGV